MTSAQVEYLRSLQDDIRDLLEDADFCTAEPALAADMGILLESTVEVLTPERHQAPPPMRAPDSSLFDPAFEPPFAHFGQPDGAPAAPNSPAAPLAPLAPEAPAAPTAPEAPIAAPIRIRASGVAGKLARLAIEVQRLEDDLHALTERER